MVFCFSDLYSSRQDFVWIILITMPQGDVKTKHFKTLLIHSRLVFLSTSFRNCFWVWSRYACKSPVQVLNENILEVTTSASMDDELFLTKHK